MKPVDEKREVDTTDQRFFTNPTDERKDKETIEQSEFSTDIVKGEEG